MPARNHTSVNQRHLGERDGHNGLSYMATYLGLAHFARFLGFVSTSEQASLHFTSTIRFAGASKYAAALGLHLSHPD